MNRELPRPYRDDPFTSQCALGGTKGTGKLNYFWNFLYHRTRLNCNSSQSMLSLIAETAKRTYASTNRSQYRTKNRKKAQAAGRRARSLDGRRTSSHPAGNAA